MGRLIDSADLFECETCFRHMNGCDMFCDEGKGYTPDMSKIKTVDAKPVVHGHWIIKRSPSGARYSICSECETNVVDYSDRKNMRKLNLAGANFCPNCGAKMDGERKEE